MGRVQHASSDEQLDEFVEACKTTGADVDPATVQLLVAPEQRDQLAVDEAVLPRGDEGRAYELLQIGEGRHAVAGQGIELVPAGKLLLEEATNDFLFVAEVVVEVAGADAEGVGDVIGRDRRCARLIEEMQGDRQDTFTGLHCEISKD